MQHIFVVLACLLYFSEASLWTATTGLNKRPRPGQNSNTAHPQPAGTSPATDPNDELWDQWKRQLELVSSTVPSQDPKSKSKRAFHPAGLGSYVDLSNPSPQIRNRQLFTIADAVPDYLFYKTNAANSFSTNYELYLEELSTRKLGNYSADQSVRLENLHSRQSELAARLSEVRNNAHKAWVRSQTSQPFEGWASSKYQEYRAIKQQLDSVEIDIQRIETRTNGIGAGLIQKTLNKVRLAKEDFKPTGYNMPIDTATTDDGQTIQTFSPTYYLFGFEKAYSEWLKGPKKQVKFQIAGNSKKSNSRDFGWGFDLTTPMEWAPFISIQFKSGSKTAMKNKVVTSFAMNVTLSHLGSFQVRPGTWYDPVVINRFRQHVKDVNPPFFGNDGTLNNLITNVVLGYQPAVSVRLDKAMYNEFTHNIKIGSGGEIKFGPFSIPFGPNINGDIEQTSFDDSNQVIKFKSTSELPLILAVTSENMGI
ncbi:hypothetical protein BKA69DRAFT_1070008 [Paraphysoderma sedebokerense]|nr:hypothetical protein BKA69DRAFT_1070008 [Paraphysoderma sedebokerense]